MSAPRRTCTLLAGIRIQRGAREDWDRLAPLHYRSHHAGAVSDIFRMVHKPTRNEKGEGQRDEGTKGRRRLARGLPGSPPRLRGARRETRNERRVSVRSAAPRPCSPSRASGSNEGRPEPFDHAHGPEPVEGQGRRAEGGNRKETANAQHGTLNVQRSKEGHARGGMGYNRRRAADG
jgi:hypothetical protein